MCTDLPGPLALSVGSHPFRPQPRRGFLCLLAVAFLWLLAGALNTRAVLQFDVFLGYDGAVREAAWFPVACEILNDGPSFNAIFELSAGNIGTEQVRRVPLELPTNTRKRFVIPVFAYGGRFFQWQARLLDEKGKVYAERPGLQPRILAWEAPLLGAVPRSFAGTPILPEGRPNRPEFKPQVARIPLEQFPDNPIALEGLDAVYLSSEKAITLKVNQVAALLAWLQAGGRLIVGIEQLADVTATPWLQQLLPGELADATNVAVDKALQDWIQDGAITEAGNAETRRPVARPGRRQNSMENLSPDLTPDPKFEEAQMPVSTIRLRDGRVRLAAQNAPLVVEANRGRGQVTLLTFSPEREPFRSWKHRGWFWSKVMEVPTSYFRANDVAPFGGWSLDGVFGALIDSRQIRKLPVEWLLLLLVVYLVVIGPFDQYWLKRINRQMLTWITFPTYVVLFSLLIYFIGYKLRAGETEWNELQVVDILPRGPNAILRGRTFASIYSSANARYQLAFAPPGPEATDRSYASLRGELLDLFRGGQEGSRATVDQYGNLFRAEVFVPVWTSLLYVNDWYQPAKAPLSAALSFPNGQTHLEVVNHLDRPLSEARFAFKGQIYELGTFSAGQKKSFSLEAETSVPLASFVLQHSASFQGAVQHRRDPVGREQGYLDNLPLVSMVASLTGEMPRAEHQRNFVSPPGMDLTPLLQRGQAVLMAWDPGQGYSKPIQQFAPPRLKRNSLLRLLVPPQVQPEA